jgi:multidrug resistance efflux pump
MSGANVMVRYGVPALALGLLGFTAWSVSANYSPRTITAPVLAAPVNPYDTGVAASGIIEPASEVVAIAIERGGVVSHVDVAADAKVVAGQPLFGIDDRAFRAVVAQQEAAVAAAQAVLTSADQSIVLQRYVIAQAVANLANANAENARAALDRDRYRTLARDEWASRQRLESAKADASKASANTALAEAGVAAAQQQSDVLIANRAEAEARLALAKASLEQARVDLDRTVVRAPMDGAILKVNVRLGEYAQAGALATPLMTMGTVDPLHVRVDVDEGDSWRICPGSAATARLRGNAGVSVPLSFVRFEPYVMPKRSLTDDTAERVDTRVLQVIYAFAPAAFPAFVGQQIDVFIEAPAPTDSDAGAGSARCGAGSLHPQAVATRTRAGVAAR